MSLIAELQRRNVIRVGTAYVAFAWLVVQVLDSLAPVFGLSDPLTRLVVIVLAIGLVPVLVASWLFELTPEGLARDNTVDHDAPARRNAAKRLDQVIIAMLAVAVSYFAFDKFVLDPGRDADIAREAAEQARDAALVDAFGEHSIAVMPFADLSPDKDQEYFSDGVAEEIINLLSRIRNLRVVARSSAFSFKGQNLPASEIASRLNVNYILEGSIRRMGDRLRVTTTMIDGRTDTQLWSENFDREFGDIFAIQDEIANEVVDRLELQISGEMPLADRFDPESYSLFLQARHLLQRQRDEGAAEAETLLEEALARDPNNVAALLLYASIYGQNLYWGHLTREQWASQLREKMDRVLAIDPGNPEAQVILANLKAEVEGSLSAQLDAASLGLRLMPTDTNTNRIAAYQLRRLGRLGLSSEYSRYVLGKDPLCAACLRGYMFTLIALGDYPAAAEINRRYRTVTGGSGEYYQGIIELLRGDAEAALATIESAQTIPFVQLQGKVIAYWTLGRIEAHEAALSELEASVEDEKFERYLVRPEDFLASAYAWVGRSDEAMDILDRRIDSPASSGPRNWNIDPLLRSLHDDPRWPALLERAGLAPHQLRKFDIEKLFPGPGTVPVE
jgi:TolB-like protein